MAQTVGRDAEQVEVLLVPRIVDAGDDLRHAVLLARELADDDVVLVVARGGDEDVRRPRDAGLLEDEELGRVARLHPVLELLLEALEAVAPLLDERHLVAHRDEAAHEVRADLPAADDDDVHQAGASAYVVTASISARIARDVGQIVRMPSVS